MTGTVSASTLVSEARAVAQRGRDAIAKAIARHDWTGPLLKILRGLWADAYLVGWVSASGVLAHHGVATGIAKADTPAPTLSIGVDWGHWTPGDPDAAKTILGRADALGGLFKLVDSGVTVADKVVASRMDRLAHILIDGIETGKAPATIATALKTVLANPQWAHMVALTETTRASTSATLLRYGRNGVPAIEWATALDQRVCDRCQVNEDQGAIPIGSTFPDGSDGPPGHPLCRCSLYPAWLTADEARAAGADIGPVLAGEGTTARAREGIPELVPARSIAAPSLPGAGAGGGAVPVRVEIRQVLQDARSAVAVSRAFELEAQRITGRAMDAEFAGSVQTAREHAEGLLRGLERFPKADLRFVESAALESSAYAETEGPVIRFNTGWTSDRRRYLNTLDKDVGSGTYGWHPGGTNSPVAVAIHEFGHILDINTLGGSAQLEIRSLVNEAVRHTTHARVGADPVIARELHISFEVSRYAATDGWELAAEAFADVMMNGERASKLSHDIYDVLVSEYKLGKGALGPIRAVIARSIPAPADLSKLKLPELRALAKERGLASYSKLTKPQLLERLGGEAKPIAAGKPAAKPDLAPGYSGARGTARRRQREEVLTLIRDAGGERGIQGVADREAAEALESMGYLRRTPAGNFALTDKGRAYFGPTPPPVAAEVPLAKLKVTELRALAKDRGIAGYGKLTKPQLLERLGGPGTAETTRPVVPKIVVARPVEYVPPSPHIGPTGPIDRQRFEKARVAAKKNLNALDAAPVRALYEDPKYTTKITGLEAPQPLPKAVQQAVTRYMGSPASINNLMRLTPERLARYAGSPEDLARMVRTGTGYVGNLDKAMAASPLSSDVVVYRGIPAERVRVMNNLLEEAGVTGRRDFTGLVWTDGGFVSTSTSREYAEHAFAESATPSKEPPILMRIVVPRGTGALRISDAEVGLKESELLLQRGLTFQVVADNGVARGGYGARLLDVEIVPAGVA